MSRNSGDNVQTLFACLITLQFVLVVFHDWVDIPGWTHGSQVQSIVGRRKLWLATLINAIFPGLAVAFAIYFWNRPKPDFVTKYWVIYCAVTLGSAIAMWYIPYFFGATDGTQARLRQNVRRHQASSSRTGRQSQSKSVARVLSHPVCRHVRPRFGAALEV